MMKCQNAQDLLKPLSDGRLKGDVLRRVCEHIESCAACRSRLSPADLIEVLPALDETIEPSEDFGSRFYAELEMRRTRQVPEKKPQHSGFKFNWMSGWAWRLAAASVLTVLVGVGLYTQQSSYRIPDTSAVFYEIEVTENLPLLQDMALFNNLDLFENLDAIENLPQ